MRRENPLDDRVHAIHHLTRLVSEHVDQDRGRGERQEAAPHEHRPRVV